MLVLNGAYRGSEAVLLGLDEDTFSCSVRINSVSVLFLSSSAGANVPYTSKSGTEC